MLWIIESNQCRGLYLNVDRQAIRSLAKVHLWDDPEQSTIWKWQPTRQDSQIGVLECLHAKGMYLSVSPDGYACISDNRVENSWRVVGKKKKLHLQKLSGSYAGKFLAPQRSNTQRGRLVLVVNDAEAASACWNIRCDAKEKAPASGKKKNHKKQEKKHAPDRKLESVAACHSVGLCVLRLACLGRSEPVLTVGCPDSGHPIMKDASTLLRKMSSKYLEEKQIIMKHIGVGPSGPCSLWEFEGVAVVGMATKMENRRQACSLAMALELALEASKSWCSKLAEFGELLRARTASAEFVTLFFAAMKLTVDPPDELEAASKRQKTAPSNECGAACERQQMRAVSSVSSASSADIEAASVGAGEKHRHLDSDRPVAFCSHCGTSQSRDEAKFCDECGTKYLSFPQNDRDRDVTIEGFTIGTETRLRCDEDAWDGLRAAINAAVDKRDAAKLEVDSDSEPVEFNTSEIQVIDDFEDHVFALQASISSRFRKGGTLQSLISKLQAREVDPMSDDWLVLNVATARIKNYKIGRRFLRYYSFDHRRLWCMHRAKCPRLRVRVVMHGSAFNEFASKAAKLGRKVSELEVR